MIIKNLRDIISLTDKNLSVTSSLQETVDSLDLDCEINLEMDAVFVGGVSEDADLEAFLEEMGWRLDIIDNKTSLLTYLSDLECVDVPRIDMPNRHGDDLPNETFYIFNECKNLNKIISFKE